MQKKYDIAHFQELAKTRNAVCLSAEYLGNNKALEFKCEKGHWFKVSPEKIYSRGYWCPECTGRRQVYNLRSFSEKVERSTKFEFLSSEYFGVDKEYLFKCEKGHEVKLLGTYALEDRSCPKCKGRDRLNIEYFRSYAIKKGGRCLSKEYIRKRDPLNFECSMGHKFNVSPSKLFSRDYWCPRCTGRSRRHTVETIKEFCSEKKWKFLSSEFKTVDHRYWFECDKGHKVEMIAQNVLKNVGCRTCAGKALLTIEQFHEIARQKGGKCLTKEFTTSKEYLEFECDEGHRWKAKPNEIKNQGTWCKKCAGLGLGTIDEMYQLAKERGGKCLSKKYTNNNTKLKWQCVDGHIWHATPRDVKHSKSWCPYCVGYKNELRVKYLFELLFGVEFQTTRKVLGNRWELDGYNETLRYAFEYNGEQHYQDVHFFSKNQSLKKRQKADADKAKRCEELGIELFVIPHFEVETDEELYDYTLGLLSNKGIYPKIKSNKNSLIKKLKKLYTNHSELKIVQELCKSKGGDLISETYLNKSSKLKVKCKNGHEWETTHTKLEKGNWCVQCKGLRKKRTLEDMKSLARKKGGECLSKSFSLVSDILLWKCKNGHTWEAPASRIIYTNSWCKKCYLDSKSN